jgi:non-specific serine/threonine protein kinase
VTGYCLLGLAALAAQEGGPERAARLWGAAAALREAHGLHLPALLRARSEGYAAAARAQVGEAAFAAAWAAGRAMTLEQAVADALEEPGDA